MILRRLTIVMLVVIVPLCSGCVLGMAALIRWDQMRYKKQQEEARKAKEAEKNGEGDLRPDGEEHQGDP